MNNSFYSLLTSEAGIILLFIITRSPGFGILHPKTLKIYMHLENLKNMFFYYFLVDSIIFENRENI